MLCLTMRSPRAHCDPATELELAMRLGRLHKSADFPDAKRENQSCTMGRYDSAQQTVWNLSYGGRCSGQAATFDVDISCS